MPYTPNKENQDKFNYIGICDAVVDGKTIHWEKKRRFEGLTEAQIASKLLKN